MQLVQYLDLFVDFQLHCLATSIANSVDFQQHWSHSEEENRAMALSEILVASGYGSLNEGR